MSFSKGTALFAFFALFSLLGIVLAGCLNQGDASAATATPTVKAFTGEVIAESKTGRDKVQEAIELALADGTYAKDVTYSRPNGNETVSISITVKDDVVTAASVKGNTTSPFSKKWMGAFNGALPELVVGKKINELNLPKNVAGSSLTNGAFQAYVADLLEKK